MVKHSIFKKTFIYLLSLMLIITLIIHMSIFFMYNKLYIQQKNEHINNHLSTLTRLLDHNTLANCNSILTDYAHTNHINISLKIDNDIKFYQGADLFIDVFFESDEIITLGNFSGADAILTKTNTVDLANWQKVQLQVVENLNSLDESKTIALSLVPYTLSIAFVFSLIFSYIYSKKMTTPIRKISDTVSEMTHLTQNAHIHIDNRDELGALATDINSLYSELLNVIENYKTQNQTILDIEKERLNFFRATSHELKTPLTRLSILTENMQYNIGKYSDHRTYLAESLNIINELSAMLSELLNSLKLSGNINKPITDSSVKSSLEKTIATYTIIAKSKCVNLTPKLSGDFTLKISEENLQKVLSNILSNAIKYLAKNGQIKIELTNNFLAIYNDAVHLSDDEFEKLFKGDYVLTKNKDLNSSGLGLYIVKTILDNHQIKYSFTPHNDGYMFSIFAKNIE